MITPSGCNATPARRHLYFCRNLSRVAESKLNLGATPRPLRLEITNEISGLNFHNLQAR
jgi:hypothetical protein